MEHTPEVKQRILEESGEAIYIVHHDDQTTSGSSDAQQQDNGWDSLKDVPFRGEQTEQAVQTEQAEEAEEEMSM